MRRLICTFVVRIWLKHVFLWCDSHIVFFHDIIYQFRLTWIRKIYHIQHYLMTVLWVYNRCNSTQVILIRCYDDFEWGVSTFWICKASRKLLCIKVTPDLHLTYGKNGGNLGLVLKMKNITCLWILLTKHEKYTYLYLFKFVWYSIVAFKAN